MENGQSGLRPDVGDAVKAPPDPHLIVELRTLTPLWTGGIDGDCSRGEKESGILGSLRFWYGGILRAAGFPPCSEKNPCKDDNLCLVCDLFGATGHARRFRMEVDGLGTRPVHFLVKNKKSGLANKLMDYFPDEKRTARWAPNGFSLTFRPRAGSFEKWDEYKARILYILARIADLGGLGAKTQLGFGQVEIDQIESDQSSDTLELLLASGESVLAPKPNVPLTNGEFTVAPGRFFSLTVPFTADVEHWITIGTEPGKKKGAYKPCAPEIRELVLQNLSTIPADSFGAPGITSRIHISHPFHKAQAEEYSVKIWGDPELASAGAETEIRTILQTHHYIQRQVQE
jgi:CRISPR type III-B/RAMP module RAMP protein Cmr1